jgi:predicted metal-binding membrane protein
VSTAWAALFVVAALAWALTLRSAAGMAPSPGTMGRGVGGFLVQWTLMMTAMMLPSVSPVVSLYTYALRQGSTGWVRAARSGGLVAGYLTVWAAFGLLGYAAAWSGGRLAAHAPGVAPWIGAGVLAAAGMYQLSPLKGRCLSHCRSPLGFLIHFGGYRGRLRDLRVGLYHGGYCVGCCWGLMVVLVAVGVMNLAWMAGLAAVVFVEKTWRHGKGFSLAFGVALIVFACFVPAHPGLVPGLHGASMTSGAAM